MKIVKVEIKNEWTSFFVQGLYKGIDRDEIWKVCDDEKRGWPCVMNADGAEVLDADEVDDYAKRAVDVFAGDIESLVKEIRFFLEVPESAKWLAEIRDENAIVTYHDEPLAFDIDFVADVLKATGGKFLNVPYTLKQEEE